MKKLYQNLKRLFLILVILFASGSFVFATHERSGAITFAQIAGYTYSISVTTYTRTSSPADRPTLTIFFGDGDSAVFSRMYKVSVAPDISVNFYQDTHTYSNPGIYKIYFEDPNRNADVVNIPNSVNVPFYVESELIVNPIMGYDNSPILTQPPIDFACVNRLFIYNPGAYDPDGDSLSYQLAICETTGGVDIAGYTFPSDYCTAGGSFTLNPVTGDMIWRDPDILGAFNVAFEVHEWRKINGVYFDIGYVKEDMQIYVGACPNLPPVADSIPAVCVLAGDTATFSICAHDPDGENITLKAFGSTVNFNPDSSKFLQTNFNNDTVCGIYTWQTSCLRVRTQPYHVIIKASDLPGDTGLVYLRDVSIRVVGPPPLNPVATDSGNSILLKWQPGTCTTGVKGYNVYRRNGMYPNSVPCPCENGASAYTGYNFMAYVNGANDTTFVDDNNGKGIIHGIDYCYLITAIYNTNDNTESCASAQACTYIQKDLPVITNVSVTTTGISNGSVYIAWSKPDEFDTIKEPPPYQYKVYHSDGYYGSNYSLIATLNNINDTTLVDSLLDTYDKPYSYKVEFYYDSSGIPILSGTMQTVSSDYLDAFAVNQELHLGWQANVPWVNDKFVVFRKDPGSNVFLAVDTTTINSYIDKGLNPDSSYCYYIESYGHYSPASFVNPLINYSEQICASPSQVGVHEIDIDNDEFRIYPNPTKELLHVAFKSSTYQSVSFLIYNFVGEMIRRIDLGKKQGMIFQDIDFSNMASGLYLIQMQAENKTISKKVCH